MADTKTTGLTALAEAPNASDLLMLVDVSDTTMDAAGTNKKITFANLTSGLGGGATVVTESGDFTLDKDVHVNGSTVVIEGFGGSAGDRVVTLPTLANQPTVGYAVTLVINVPVAGSMTLGINTADGSPVQSGVILGGQLIYTGSNQWVFFTENHSYITNVDP